MSTAKCKDAIISAFIDVILEDGIGLWEAHAIDCYETKDVQESVRDKDQKEDWRLIPANDIFLCDSSLSFMDPKGLRFHVPAFMLADMDGLTNTAPLYSLTDCAISNPESCKLFNVVQKQSVSMYLEWYMLQDDYELENAGIKRALSEFWRKD